MDPEISKYRLDWALTTYIVVGLLGLSLIGWGQALRSTHSTGSGLLVAIGGALLGTGFGSAMSNLRAFDEMKHITRILESSQESSTEYELRRLDEWKTTLHHYYVTKMNDENVWRHAVINFSSSSCVGKLVADVPYLDKSNDIQIYRAEARLKDDRLVMTFKSERNNEPADVCIYPFMTKERFNYRSGLEFRETWDGPNTVGPAILRRDPVPGGEKSGAVSEQVAESLTQMWKRDFLTSNRIILVDLGGKGADKLLEI